MYLFLSVDSSYKESAFQDLIRIISFRGFKLKINRLFLQFILFFCCFTAFGQAYYVDPTSKIDSLEQVLKGKTKFQDLVSIQNELARLYKKKQDYPTALRYGYKALHLSKKYQYEEGLAKSYMSLGSIQSESGDYAYVKTNLYKGIEYGKKKQLLSDVSWGYDQLGHYYFAVGDTLASLNHHKTALAYRKQLEKHYRIGDSQDNIGLIYSQLGKYEEAITYFKASYDLFVELQVKQRIAISAGNVGLVSFWMGNRKDAIHYFLISLKNFEQCGEEDRAYWVRSEIATVYLSILDFEHALEYNQKNLNIARKKKDVLRIGDALRTMGRTYVEMKSYSKAMKVINQGIQLHRQEKYEQGIMSGLYERGECYYRQNLLSEAYRDFQDAYQIAKRLNQVRVAAQCMSFIGAIHVQRNENKQAREALNEALVFFQKNKAKNQLHFIYRQLVTLDSLSGNFQQAFEHYKHYITNADSDKEISNETEKLIMRYEFEKKQAEAEAALKAKQVQRNLAIAGLFMALVLAGVLVFIFRSRSRRIKAEKELLEVQKRELQLTKETEAFKTRFLTNITHEFRTPLTLIQGHLDVLQEAGRKEDQKRFHEMAQNGEYLLLLINQLLDLSKMESGQYKLKYVAGNPLQEIEQLLFNFRAYADEKGLELIVKKSESAVRHFQEHQWNFSKEALMSIVNNLVYNAMKYTPASGKIVLAVDWVDERLIIEVSDTGIGIPEKYLPHVFERFYQVDDEERKSVEGSGIGLAMVKELVLLHDGNVAVKSEEGKGTTFIVELQGKSTIDFVQGNQLSLLAQKIVEEPQRIQLQPIGDDLPLILVIEDQVQIGNFIIENLGENHAFIYAENGSDGLKLAKEHVPDLIISDVMMPGLSGLELCRQLKNNVETSHIPIMLLTAKADHSDLVIGLEQGADDYLTKPFSLAELRLRVRNMLYTQQMLRSQFETTKLTQVVSESLQLTSKDLEFVNQLNEEIEGRYANPLFDINELADIFCFSLSTLHRKLKGVTGKSPAEYLRLYRLQRASEYLLSGENVSETCWKVGFEDVTYFSKVYKKYYGYAPSETKNHL